MQQAPEQLIVASGTQAGAPPALESVKRLVIFGVIAGVMTVLAVSTFFLPEPTASDALASYEKNTGAYSYGLGVLLLFPVGATPFIALLGSLLVARGHGLVWGAMLLSVSGMFALALRAGTFLGALYTLANTQSPPAAGLPAYEAGVWWGIGNNLNLLGIIAWGVGLLLFGLAAWNSRILPNWLALVGVIAGASSFVLLVPIVPFLLIPIAFGIWCFATPVIVWRARSRGAPRG